MRARPRVTPWRTRLALLTASTIATLALLEVVFRVFLPQPLYAIQSAPWGFWHIPNTCLVHGSEPTYENSVLRGTEFVTHICYNSLGLRERELPIAKSAGTKRVLILGDSYGEGMEVEFDQTVGQVLERSLDRDRAVLSRAGSRSPPPPLSTRRAAADTAAWTVTKPIFAALDDSVRADGARLLVVNVHYSGDDADIRERSFRERRTEWLDLAMEDGPGLHYRYDPHWNPAGHAHAAARIAQRIVDRGLLGPGLVDRVEVINAAMSAFSTCKALHVYEAIGRRFAPDLVVAIHTASDDRNVADLDMCHVGADGRFVLRPRPFGPLDVLIRNLRGQVRSRSHFITWVSDRAVSLPLFAELRRDQIPLQDPDAGSR